MPTFKEFIQRARALGVKESTEEDDDGGLCPCLRMGDGPPVFLPKNIQDTDPIQSMQLASWCRELCIEPAEFGLAPGFIHDPFGGRLWDWE
jgi:hypothetical protein